MRKERNYRRGGHIALALLAAGAAALILPSCSGGGKETKKAEKVIYIGQVNPPITFNTINCPDVASQYDQQPIFDTLLGMVQPLVFQPMLADSFELKDPTTVLIKINPKANWTDGKPVSADDVAFTINLIANPKTETSIGTFITTFAGVGPNGKALDGKTSLDSLKVVDAKTLEITLSKAVDLTMIKEQLGANMRILPKHVLENVDPATFSQEPFFSAPTVTSGPFKFVKYEKDQYVEYVANPDYYRGAPKVDRLFVKLVPATNLVSQLETGEIHFNTGVGIGLIPSTDYEAAKALTTIRTKTEPNTSVQMMLFNHNTITDPKVRQAIVYAIDRPSILNKLLKGSGELVDVPYTTMNPYYASDIPRYTYDPEKAKALLAEAKWDPERVINLVVPIGNKDREQSANIITQNLADVGIKVNMTKFDFPTIMQKGKKHEFDLLLIGNNFLLDPDGVSIMVRKGAGLNFSDYKSDEMDALYERGKNEPDPATRKVIYHRVQELFHDDLPLVTIYSYQELLGISKKLTKGEPRFFGTFYDLNEWDLE